MLEQGVNLTSAPAPGTFAHALMTSSRMLGKEYCEGYIVLPRFQDLSAEDALFDLVP